MKHLVKILILLGIVTILFFQSGIYRNIFGVSTAFAVGDLTVNWGVPSGNPIFTISGLAPGQSQARAVHITNGSSTTRTIGVSGNELSETGNLADALTIIISKNGRDLYGGTTGEKTLTQFFTENALPGFVPLSTLPAGQSSDFTFTVKFKDTAGNEFQDKVLSFDLIIGLAVDVPAACQDISFTGKVINGTAGNDSLVGTNGNDLIIALEGNDRIAGLNGDDCIVGGPGTDQISGDNGNDAIDAGEGNDHVAGGNGNEVITGGSGNDTMDGANGIDQITGGPGNDIMTGGNGNDSLQGDGGTDTAVGGAGSDTCSAETKTQCEI